MGLIFAGTGALPVGHVLAQSFGAVGDGVADDRAAIQAALDAAGDGTVFLPPGRYLLQSGGVFLGQAVLRGAGRKTELLFRKTGLTGIAAVMTSDVGGRVERLVIDGGNSLPIGEKPSFETYGVLVEHADTVIDDVGFRHWRRRAIYVLNTRNPNIERCRFAPAGASTTITLTGCDGGEVVRNDLSGNPSNFGVYCDGGTTRVLIALNRANNATQLAGGTRSLEPIGITRTCSFLRVIGNHIEGSGDNGISCTGSGCLIAANTVTGNYHHGIAVYGPDNLAVGNVVHGNSRRFAVDGTAFHNITVQPAFGGRGHRAVVAANVCTDVGGAGATAGYGVRVSNQAYPLWEVGKGFSSGNPYCYFGSNVYFGTNISGSVNAGSTAPTHTSGTVSDGSILWEFLFTGSPDLHPRGVTVLGNSMAGHRIADLTGEQPTALANMVLNGNGAARGATGVRPVLAAADAGHQFYDSTLGRPIWWNGSGWRDAAGSVV